MSRRLSTRLQAVADLAVPGQPAADIGCDHAQLAAWWVASGQLPSAIASDVRAGPLRQARRVLAAAGLAAVEVRQGDGLSTLRPGEVATLALAGMGGPLMVELLERHPAVVESARRIILQPNTGWEHVREALAQRCIPLESESLTQEGEQTFLTLAFDPRTRGARWTTADIVLGPLLRREQGPVFIAWTHERLRHLDRLVERLAKTLGPDHPRVATIAAQRRRLDDALVSLASV